MARLEWRDTTMATAPLFHSFGQTVMMNASVLTGSTMVLIPRFEPSFVIEQIISHKVSVFAGVPTMYIALLRAGEESLERSEQVKHSLRLGVSGGPAPLAVIRHSESRFELPVLKVMGCLKLRQLLPLTILMVIALVGQCWSTPVWSPDKITDIQGNSVAMESGRSLHCESRRQRKATIKDQKPRRKPSGDEVGSLQEISE
ncbi:AMP-binding protein [Vibrio lentus]|nr:AMP-binding protein [Vibrio lentus]